MPKVIITSEDILPIVTTLYNVLWLILDEKSSKSCHFYHLVVLRAIIAVLLT
jgi:hypothetical protein